MAGSNKKRMRKEKKKLKSCANHVVPLKSATITLLTGLLVT